MIKLKDILLEVVSYNTWVVPDEDTLRREFKVEHEYKGLNLFNDVEDFLTKVKNSKITSISKSDDMSIINNKLYNVNIDN